jgi:hypothetical protein
LEKAQLESIIRSIEISKDIEEEMKKYGDTNGKRMCN